jgi:hypothetical protein
MIGAKRSTEAADFMCLLTHQVVGERSIRDEAEEVTHSGVYGSENVGTSNRNAGEIPARRKNKVSFAMEIIEGLVGPNRMANAGLDGHTVNIP